MYHTPSTMPEGLSGALQHPRRSLGDRYRAQATKFLKLADSDTERFHENTNWAEQNARQAILYDFTNEANWRLLANIKSLKSDEIGLRSLLSDLFAVLGRDSEQISQLSDIPILEVGVELVDATLNRDPLHPDTWAARLDKKILDEFLIRFERLDLSDPRCNVLFGRRVERLWESNGDQLCMPLARKLLSHRPQNFELWIDLGRAHERVNSFDEAWFCYDQAQFHAPHLQVRDDFRIRMDSRLDNGEKIPWSVPTIEVRDQFLLRMESLSSRIAPEQIIAEQEVEEIDDVDVDEQIILNHLGDGNYAAAFFHARRLIARGEQWAEKYLDVAKTGLSDSASVNIP